MKFITLYSLVKNNAEKNLKSSVNVAQLTKEKINKYKSYVGIKDNFMPYIEYPFKFCNYSKVIDKLNTANLYFEIESPDGFSLLEFNGIKFKSIEYDGGDSMNSLKRYENIDELNKEYFDWDTNRRKNRLEIEQKANELENKFFRDKIKEFSK